MASIPLSGVSSVVDRTLFTRRAPIVKAPLPVLTGADLVVVSPTTVRITSASFTADDVGKMLRIAGSLGGRNDGTFVVAEVPNSVTAILRDANFEMVDAALTLAGVVALANALKVAFNRHLLHTDSRVPLPSLTHVNNDEINTVATANADDLPSALALLNALRTCYAAHTANSGGEFHLYTDVWNPVRFAAARSLDDAIVLGNELRARYEAHRLERRSHHLGDVDSRVVVAEALVRLQAPPDTLVGPFVWTLLDPRAGMVADSPSDVVVHINGAVVEAEAVFGMFGAVVLPARPAPGDQVSIDYQFINNPPARFLRLNSPEFVLNQDKNSGIMGLPSHRYRAHSYLIDPGHTPDLISPVGPARIGWKYKAFEREYTATLNDPAKLLLNSPVRKLKYPVFDTVVHETTIAYDASVVPQDAPDPWTLQGDGSTSVANGILTLVDSELQSSVVSRPPFFTHTSDIITDSIVSAAFRASVGLYTPDGVFTGVGFGLSDGYSVALVGFILTDATNLSSAVAMANSLKANFNAHLVQPTAHNPDDTADAVVLVDAKDLQSLNILINALRLRFNLHLAKADPSLATAGVHKALDTANLVPDPEATDLASALVLVNALRSAFNAHRSATGVHFVDDALHEVPKVSQVGILTSAGPQEFQENWEAGAVDWTSIKTYRLHRDASGDVKLYLSGDVQPLVSVAKAYLPSISDFEGKFDPIQQVFFGSISREATSTSYWGLIRANIIPLDANLIEDNKSVNFDGTVIPELDPHSPWITLGHGGTERVVLGGVQVESTCSASSAELIAMGASSGAFRGYMRFEPMLSPSTTSVVELTTSIEYHTFSVGERCHGLYIDDGQQSVHFAFLYHNPTPAVVLGTAVEPFTILPTDRLIIGLGGAVPISIAFPPMPGPPPTTSMTAQYVSDIINAAVGFVLAAPDPSGHVRLAYGSGASSYITVVGGSATSNAAARLGMQAGKYFGADSNPEPRISWFGENPPDAELVPWMKSGGSSISMLGSARSPVMRILDTSAADYATFTMANKAVSVGTLDPTSDWKVDARFAVVTFTPGEPVPSPVLLELHFCGALINVDEGYGGKNVELHCAVDVSDNPYLNLVTYTAGTDSLVPVAQYAFAWNDGEQHSFNIFKNLVADQLFVYADGMLLTPVAGSSTYSTLGDAISGLPSMTFGSGAEAVTNVDLRTSTSEVDWISVCAFRDSKLNDPSAALRRYIGIYKGGNPAVIGSWAIARVDWSSPHTYRIVRDPIGPVAVYVDGADTPSISMSYNPVALPPSSTSFLRSISNNRPVIAWGALDSTEISRGRWSAVRYSLGRLTLTDRLVPPRHILNQANIMASPEHLRTPEQHKHWGFTCYSGGTPEDDFMATSITQAFTTLGEGVPPVPKTQDLESRGGFVKVAVPASGVPAVNFVNYRGFLGNYEDDAVNTISAGPAQQSSDVLALVIAAANALCDAYEGHRARHDTAANVHVVDDLWNVITAPPATDLPTCIARLADFRMAFNSHIVDGFSHDPIDAAHAILAPAPADLDMCVTFVNEALAQYGIHLAAGCFHFVPAAVPYFDTNEETVADATDAASCRVLLDSLKAKFVAHVGNSVWHAKTVQYSATLNHSTILPLANQLKALFNQHLTAPGVHQFSDATFAVTAPTAVDIGSCVALANALKACYNAHVWSAALVGREQGHRIHLIQARTVGGALADVCSADPAVHSLDSALALAGDIRAAFNAHAVREVSHVEPDVGHVVQSVAKDEATLIALANALKAAFNAHRLAEVRTCKVHISDDAVNMVTAADATDLDSACVLLNDLAACYNLHRVQPGVHGSAAFIRLEPPSRVLYEGMKFWQSQTGAEGLVHSFSDDETWHVDAIRSQANKSVIYDGTLPPEQATLVSIGARPAAIVDGDTLVLEVDRNPPVTVTFQAADNTLAGVVDRINGLVPGLASVQVSEIRLTSPAPSAASSLFVNGGTARQKLGFETPQTSPWFVISQNPSDVTMEMTPGDGCLRYGVVGQSTTAYVNRVGYPLMPSTGFDLSVSLRINASGILGGEDSGIYVGVCLAANASGAPGFVAAIGWGGNSPGYQYVKLQDMTSGQILDRIPMDWLDGEFHTYNLSYDEAAGTLQLSVV